ncbi:hypothetical protein Ga0123461_0124 [Mariprofundus aestuarium]|uniref:Uncharacterized protein n=1 Tax=Mariprofundus aestuarium TaxID=1921086 RepID=A0A2K8KUZ9_MARES|nr:hypothetical protein [Mariprofundus aestuarium]ATX78577.1 hypothetical protein Ga0123461_0124 [Mariprofundus aestuarium]
MAINFHPADALIHRLLQQQGSSLSQKASPQQREGSGPSEKVSISEQARNAAAGEAAGESSSKHEPDLIKLYGPRGG